LYGQGREFTSQGEIMRIDDTGELIARRLVFDSIDDCYSYAGNPAESKLWYLDKSRDSWRGATIAEVMARRYGYDEGVKELNRLPEPELIPCGSEFRRRWSDTDGDEIDIDRMNEGMPCLRQRYKAAGTKQRRIATLAINVAVSGRVSASDCLWKSYAAGRLADSLESQGTRLEIACVWKSKDCLIGNRSGIKTLEAIIPVKRPDDPLNVSQLIAVLSPWFIRTAVMMSMDTFGQVSDGHGLPSDIDNPESYTYYIGTRDCLSEADAKRFIGKCNQKEMD